LIVEIGIINNYHDDDYKYNDNGEDDHDYDGSEDDNDYDGSEDDHDYDDSHVYKIRLL